MFVTPGATGRRRCCTVAPGRDVLAVSAAKCARALPRFAREYPTEVTLIGKSNAERHLGERPVCVADQLCGSGNAALQKVAVRRHADTLLERAAKVPDRQTGDVREFVHADLVGQLSFDVLPCATQASKRHTAAHRALGVGLNRSLLHQLAYGIDETVACAVQGL